MTGYDGSLIRRAVRRLGDGPTPTVDLARDVLGLAGHPGAASAAVFQLLGTDPRFLVDSDGVWRLDPSLAPLGAALSEVPFAVVDVETTGGRSWDGHRIVEIAIVEVLGGEIVHEYQTLASLLTTNIGQSTGIGEREKRRVATGYDDPIEHRDGFASERPFINVEALRCQ